MPRKSVRMTQGKSSASSQNSSQLSQSRIDQHFQNSQVNIDEQVNKCVRYLLNNAGQNAFFRRADIQKVCETKAGSNLQQVIERATAVLKNVYGYNILACDQTEGSSKAYIVSNALPYKDYNINKDNTDPKDVKKILLLLILSHLYMTSVPVPEASLYNFLKYFNIDVNIRHALFGNVKDYIMHNLVKQKFLQVKTDPVSKKAVFEWGVRAETEISKHEVLNFVCKMFKDRQPKSWTNQYTDACQQHFENERLAEGNEMEVDQD